MNINFLDFELVNIVHNYQEETKRETTSSHPGMHVHEALRDKGHLLTICSPHTSDTGSSQAQTTRATTQGYAYQKQTY